MEVNSSAPSLDQVPGWFDILDQRVFTWLLGRQAQERIVGDILEIGTFMGKSAILLGYQLRDRDELIVCDLFGEAAPNGANQSEVDRYYGTLTLDAFRHNYETFHDRLPRIIQGPTARLRDVVERDSCRFVHIDASHLYVRVREDIDIAKTLLTKAGGVVAIDDYRSAHTPGVARAVWQAVLQDGLHPIFVTRGKLYGTWGDPRPAQDRLIECVQGRRDITLEVDEVEDGRLIYLDLRQGPESLGGDGGH